MLLSYLPLNHGLRTPNEDFFHRYPKLLVLGRHIGQIYLGLFGVFLAELSAPILAPWVHCPCFPLINHYFYKKKLSLYIHIPNIFGIGIWIWAAKNYGFSHHAFVVRVLNKGAYFLALFLLCLLRILHT